MSRDALWTYLATAFELGLPILLLVLLRRAPQLRQKAVVVLGAVMPLVLFYIGSSAAYFIDPEDPGYRFNFFAMWHMTARGYLVCAIIGLVLSLVPRPNALASRFLLAAVTVPGLFAAGRGLKWW